MADLRNFDVDTPPGEFEFEESYTHDLSGVPYKRSKLDRDYLRRIICKGEDSVLDRDQWLEWWAPRSEEEDVDP